MFNRVIQVKLIKKNKEESITPNQDDQFEGRVTVIGRLFDRVIIKAGAMALTYVLIDTGRKILVAKAYRN